MANSNRRNNTIEAMFVNGSISFDQFAIRDTWCNTMVVYFQNSFNWRPKLDGFAFDSIDAVEASRLESSFEESDVLEVVKEE